MINKLLKGLFGVVIGLVQTLLSPLETLIDTYVPQLDEVFTLFGNFLSMIGNFVLWVLSWFHVPSGLFTAVILIVIAKLTIGKIVHVVKLALAWWRTLTP